MTDLQLAALEACARRPLTAAERAEAETLMEIRNDVALAEVVSRGRVRPAATRLIGVADVLSAHEAGADLLDEMQTSADRGLHYVWRLLDAGRLPVGSSGVVEALHRLQGPARDAVLALTIEPDPCPLLEVSYRLNEAEGRPNFQKV